jgi:hypothetical protein
LGYNSTANKGNSLASIGDNLAAVFLGASRFAIAVSGGFVEWSQGHHCALLDNLDVKCWGLNSAGQLGMGHLNNLGDNAGEMEALLPVPLNN